MEELIDIFRPVLPPISIRPEPLFAVHLPWGDFTFTNSMLFTLVVIAGLTLFFLLATRRMSLVPRGAQNLAEALVEMLLGIVEGTAGRRVGRRIFPLIATLFLFILTANWAGLLRAANADLNTTLAMALLAVGVVQIAGIAAHGVGGYLKELTTPLLLAPIHIMGEISRVISLSFRLFGNIFGGEVLVTVMYVLLGSLFLGFGTFIFLGLELLFGLIQALIFSILTLVYIATAVGGHADHGAEPHAAPHGSAEEMGMRIGAKLTGQPVPGTEPKSGTERHMG
jgi:F-type H+-transporting ATPase subunit a